MHLVNFQAPGDADEVIVDGVEVVEVIFDHVYLDKFLASDSSIFLVDETWARKMSALGLTGYIFGPAVTRFSEDFIDVSGEVDLEAPEYKRVLVNGVRGVDDFVLEGYDLYVSDRALELIMSSKPMFIDVDGEDLGTVSRNDDVTAFVAFDGRVRTYPR